MTFQEAQIAGVGRLEAAGIASAVTDARRLLAHAAGTETDRLELIRGDLVDPETLDRFDRFLSARCKHQPVAQIIGRRAFWKYEFEVTPDTLDPRPETELVVELGIMSRPKHVLDLGTGTGAILLSILSDCPDAVGTGTDLSLDALRVAQRNASHLNLASRCGFQCSDWFRGVSGTFDLIVSNPPYISAEEMAGLSPDVRNWEPHLALTPGGDGLACYRRIAKDMPRFLGKGGTAILEIGATQAADVCAIFNAAGFVHCIIHKDLNDQDRVITLQR